MESKLILDETAMNRAIARISFEILEKNKGASDLLLMGIISRGVELAHRIAAKLQAVEGCPVPVGWLDITAYRDDKTPPENHADRSCFPCDIEGKTVVLVDDVIYTGRSARSAMEAVIHRGRLSAFSWRCWWTGGIGNCPSGRTLWGKTFPPPLRSR